MEALEVHNDFYPQQFAFLRDAIRYPAFIAGRGSGKTYTGARKALQWAAKGGLGVIAGPNFPAVKQGPKPAFFAALKEAGIAYFENKNDAKVYIPRFDAEVQFAGLDNDTYLRGPNFRWGWIDELDFVADPEMWRAFKAAVREGPAYQLFATSTPKGRRIIYREWEQEADDFHRFYRATSLDNPFMDAASYVQGLGYSGRFYDQEILAQFVGFEGLVYPGFDRSRHVKTVDTEGWSAILGVDAGTRNPSTIITIRHVGDARHQEREFYQRGLGSDALKAAVREEADRVGRALTSIEVDPSAAGLIIDLELLGYPVNKANNNVTDGIREVTTALDHGLTVDPSCIHTIDEYESYAYPDSTKREDDKPVKQNDHCMDASRYALMGLAVPAPQYWVA